MEPTIPDTRPRASAIEVARLMSERELQRLGLVVNYIPQHASDDVDTRSARPRYSAKAALDATIRLRQHMIVRRPVEVGQHRREDPS